MSSESIVIDSEAQSLLEQCQPGNVEIQEFIRDLLLLLAKASRKGFSLVGYSLPFLESPLFTSNNQNVYTLAENVANVIIDEKDMHALMICSELLVIVARQFPFLHLSQHLRQCCPRLIPVLCECISVVVEAHTLSVVSLLFLLTHCRDMLSDADFLYFQSNFVSKLVDIAHECIQEEPMSTELIKLLLAINEQMIFKKATENAVITALRVKPYTASSIGQSLIFMLNESSQSDGPLKLLLLKLVYLILDTGDVSTYFYNNDLHVLVDVFIRELNDLPDFDKTRHIYLKVLPVLVQKSQYRNTDYPYKKKEILQTLRNALQEGRRSLQSLTDQQEKQKQYVNTTIVLTEQALQVFNSIE